MLCLDESGPGPRDPAQSRLQVALWIRYLLDSAASVGQALDLLDTFRLVPIEMRSCAARSTWPWRTAPETRRSSSTRRVNVGCTTAASTRAWRTHPPATSNCVC
ncbi:hypothetical protein SAMN05444921_1194 [Streptomyces wuyuanensis]|uniref:Uncharacterized protein n=1 Tax=Streptomyces wuyuanensis TaxID=1196353 RepID=A0A1G9YMU4_9ACTN|nr:hypothetical protein SAMN05444921_1194 [Streptomyces wuyuanensis]